MKQHPTHLGIFGGTPLFNEPLVVGRPDMSSRNAMLERISDVLKSGWLTNNGPVVQEFESAICDQTGAAHCVAVCNGTMALQIMAKACGLTGEVILPAFTYIATAHALEWIGLTPIFADVDPATHTIDVDSVRRCITPQTSAILGVHIWGNPCDVDALQQLANEHHLRLMFDACHAFGCRRHGQAVGTFGEAEAFSFHATKFVHSLEGGAILTQSDELAARMRLMRNFGITGLDTIESCGINGKLSEVSAAAGLTSLATTDERMLHNRNLQRTYTSALQNCPGLDMLSITADQGGNSQYAVAQVDTNRFGLNRDQLLRVLRAEGIFARSYFVPGCHRAAPYASSRAHTPVSLPNTEAILSSVMQLPTGPAVPTGTAARVAEFLIWVQRNSHAICDRLDSAAPQSNHSADPAFNIPALPLAG